MLGARCPRHGPLSFLTSDSITRAAHGERHSEDGQAASHMLSYTPGLTHRSRADGRSARCRHILA